MNYEEDQDLAHSFGLFAFVPVVTQTIWLHVELLLLAVRTGNRAYRVNCKGCRDFSYFLQRSTAYFLETHNDRTTAKQCSASCSQAAVKLLFVSPQQSVRLQGERMNCFDGI
jgi:hypothetical protein